MQDLAGPWRPECSRDDRTGSDSDSGSGSDRRQTCFTESAAFTFLIYKTHASAAPPLHDPSLLSSIYLPEKPYLPYSQKTFVQTPLKEVSLLVSLRVLHPDHPSIASTPPATNASHPLLLCCITVDLWQGPGRKVPHI